MMYAGRSTLVIAMVAVSVAALPNHLKAVVIDDADPIPVKETSVSASFGPYSATAGLGGSGSGGGLFAGAESPHGSAGAGLGGGSGSGGLGASASSAGTGASHSSSSTSTGTGHKKPVVHQGPGLFDGIFNIPISVLQAVNTYLNNRGPVTKPIHRRRGHQPVVTKTVIPEKSQPDAPEAEASDRSPAAAVESGTHSGAHTGQGTVVLQKRVNYDDIFNIPISALKSVNQLLNGGMQGKK